MKQTILMILLTLYGTAGVLIQGPFAAIAIYYLFAVLRPQYIWDWALPYGVPWSQFVAVAALIAVIVQLFGGNKDFPNGSSFRTVAAHKLVIMFGVWVCLSHLTALDKEVSWIWLLEYAKILFMFYLATIVLRQQAQVWRFFLMIALALTYLAYEMTFLYVVEHRVDIYHNGYSGLDNNGAGLMFAMGVPIAVFAWDGVRQWWRWIFALAVPLILHTVMISYSRGAMLSVLIAIPLILLRIRRRWQVAAMLPLAATAILIMAGPAIRGRFFSIGQYEVDQSASSRFGSWRAGIRMANDYPMFGVGIRNSSIFSHRYGADMEGRVIHSQYFQILADSGYPALFFYCAAIIASFIAIRRARARLAHREDEEAERLRGAVSGVECSLLVFVFGACFLSLEVFELPYIMMLLSAQIWAICRASDQPAKIAPDIEPSCVIVQN